MASGGGSLADKPMRLLEHLEELRVRLIRVLAVTLPLFLFIITFEVRTVSWNGIPLPVGLGFDPFSALASQVYRGMADRLVPPQVELTQLTPAQALSVQFKVAAFLAATLGMPVIAYEGWMFVAPALYHHERRLIAKVVLPATALFLAGAVFAFLVVLPFTFSWLYGIGAGLGAQRFILSLDDFLDIVLIVMAAMGVAFQTPLIMWGLSAIGLVPPAQWRRWWRYAVIAFFAFGAVVTPDGSGVTMVMVALPMTVLYVVGLALADARAGSGRPGRRQRRVVAASIAVVLILGGLGYFYLSGSQAPTPEAAQEVARGRALLELPVMTYYGMAVPPGNASSTRVAFSADASVVYTWANASADGTRLVFLPDLPPGAPLAPGPWGNSLRLYPGRTGHATLEAGGPGSWLLTSLWILEYRVLLHGRPSAGDRWIEVRYALRPAGERVEPLPTANVSLPRAADLLPAGYRLVDDRGGTDLTLGLNDAREPGRPFGFEFPGPPLDLGPLGRAATHLGSRFAWGPGDGYSVRVKGPGEFRGVVALFWDLRFGSLYAQLL